MNNVGQFRDRVWIDTGQYKIKFITDTGQDEIRRGRLWNRWDRYRTGWNQVGRDPGKDVISLGRPRTGWDRDGKGWYNDGTGPLLGGTNKGWCRGRPGSNNVGHPGTGFG